MSKNSIYRREALEHYNSVQEEGDILRISPAWTQWLFWFLMATLGMALLYGVVGNVDEYASGPAVVLLEGRVDLTSQNSGIVSSVEVQPGSNVKAGQRLVSLVSEEEAATLARLSREFELQLVRYLKDPSDSAARQALTTLRAEQELARSRLETRAIRAPRDGVVNDVRVRPGQYLTPGASALSLVPKDVVPTLHAFLPGYYRPYLRTGTSMRLELEGFRHEYREVTIDQVGDQIIGPDELARSLGPRLAGAFELKGPIILVRAHLPTQGFESDGERYDYFDGMPAQAEARVRTQSILVTLIPGLKELFHHGR